MIYHDFAGLRSRKLNQLKLILSCRYHFFSGYELVCFGESPPHNQGLEMEEQSLIALALDSVQTMPAHFENGENVTDRPPVYTKTARFCRQISKSVDSENRTLTSIFENGEKCDEWASRLHENGTFFCRQISKSLDFENRTLTSIF